MKRHKRIWTIAGIVATVAVLACVGAGQYLLGYALKPKHSGRDLATSWAFIREKYPHTAQWCDSIQRPGVLKEVFIANADNVRLHAYYLKAVQPTAHTAVIVHGYTDNAVRMMMIGYLYQHCLGYNILLPDLQTTGLSGGDAMQMGWLDRIDVSQWIRLAPGLFGDSLRVVVHGISMGAATTMMLSGERQPGYVKAYVEDCGYTSVWDQFAHELKAQFHLPAFPLLHVASAMCGMEYGWTFKEASAERAVQRCEEPMLFIHGGKDDYVPTEMVYRLYRVKSGRKQLWITPEVDHANSYFAYPEAYTDTVGNFLKHYLP